MCRAEVKKKGIIHAAGNGETVIQTQASQTPPSQQPFEYNVNTFCNSLFPSAFFIIPACICVYIFFITNFCSKFSVPETFEQVPVYETVRKWKKVESIYLIKMRNKRKQNFVCHFCYVLLSAPSSRRLE